MTTQETTQDEFETTIEDLTPELELTPTQKTGLVLYRNTRKNGESVIELLLPTDNDSKIVSEMDEDAAKSKESKSAIQDEIDRRMYLREQFVIAKELAKIEHGAIAKQLFEDNLTVNPTFPDKPEKPSNDFERYQDTWSMTDEEVVTFKADRQRADDDHETALEIWEEAYEVYETQKAEHYSKLRVQFDGSKELTLSIADVNQWKHYLTGYTINYSDTFTITPMDSWRDNDHAGYATMIALDGNYPTRFMSIKVDALVIAIPHNRDYAITYSASYSMREEDTFRVEIKEQGDGHFSDYDLTLNWSNETVEEGTLNYRHAAQSSVNMSSQNGTMGEIEQRIRFLSIALEIGKRWELQAPFVSDEYL